MPPPTPTRAALYARISTTGHGQDVGLQLDALRQVAAARGWVVVQEFVDEGISGTRTSRPALDAMVEAARLGKVEVVMCYRLDRIGRSLSGVVALLDTLTSLKVGARSWTRSPEGNQGLSGRPCRGSPGPPPRGPRPPGPRSIVERSEHPTARLTRPAPPNRRPARTPRPFTPPRALPGRRSELAARLR